MWLLNFKTLQRKWLEKSLLWQYSKDSKASQAQKGWKITHKYIQTEDKDQQELT